MHGICMRALEELYKRSHCNWPRSFDPDLLELFQRSFVWPGGTRTPKSDPPKKWPWWPKRASQELTRRHPEAPGGTPVSSCQERKKIVKRSGSKSSGSKERNKILMRCGSKKPKKPKTQFPSLILSKDCNKISLFAKLTVKVGFIAQIRARFTSVKHYYQKRELKWSF